VKRQLVTIDEERCTGCGLCIPNCPEGALQIIDGRARLVSDLCCDGLGACIGHCPEGAIRIEERDARPYDEATVMEHITKQGPNVIRAHLEHLAGHGQDEYARAAVAYLLEHGIDVPEEFAESSCRGGEPESAESRFGGCPGTRIMNIEANGTCGERAAGATTPSQLRQWPIQIMLVPPHAPFLAGADLLIAADCVPFAYADFHAKLLRGKILLVGCPKLDDADHYGRKLTEMFRQNDVKSVTVAHMEVPCCFGMLRLVQSAIEHSGKQIPLETQMISIRGHEC
jgi:NAD-dependent dihydropyrimidine dehydrogenase PreA subunit